MPLPKNITREHIIKAITEIDRDGYDPMYEAHRYSLLLNDRHYPPKHVVRLANRIANGGKLDDLMFFPYEANRLLDKLDFTVSGFEKRQGGRVPEKSTVPVGTTEVVEIFAKLEQLLRGIEPKTSYIKTVAHLTSELEYNGRIPKHIAMRMHTMRITRNKIVHETHAMSAAQRRVIRLTGKLSKNGGANNGKNVDISQGRHLWCQRSFNGANYKASTG